ncbi:MAG: hypothetical protein ACT4P0_02775 [Panacagrimonas sp.]
MSPAPPTEPSADIQRIAPRLPPRAAEAKSSRPAPQQIDERVSARTFVLGLAALFLLAGLGFWVLPPALAPSKPAAKPAASAPSVATTPAAPDTPAAEPAPPSTLSVMDDPELLRARATAQSARSQFDTQSAQLTAAAVDRWAAERWTQARQQAEAGAAAFTARNFPEARARLESAAALTAQMLAELPQRLDAALAAGNQALAAGDKPAAQAAFELAAALEPGNARARRGLERTAQLDAVLAKLQTAGRLEQAGDLAGARAAWKEALALDADTQAARDALARLDAQAADAEFRRVLGDALGALDRGQLDLAESRIGRARALRAGDPAVAQAATRLADARKTLRLNALSRDAQAQVQAENWSGAIASYQAALKLEPNTGFARDGLAQAEPRAALDGRLQSLVERPERLGDAAVGADAEQVLRQARAVTAAGPRLQGQIATLERALAQAAVPVPVELVSDQQTEVTIYKVGVQGRFATRSTALKPGRYVVVGSRNGYRDVRRELQVAPGAGPVRLDIRCEEAL